MSVQKGYAGVSIPKPVEKLSPEEIKRKQYIGRVTTHVYQYLTNEFVSDGFAWLPPTIFSKSTDPLWPDPGASIEKRIEVEIYEETVRAMSSMIVHKIVGCSLVYPKLFSLSPNLRIEKRERASTGKHAYEFTQLDFEARYATSKDIRRLVEGKIRGLVGSLKKHRSKELSHLRGHDNLRVPKIPFEVYDRGKLLAEKGESWEVQLLKEIDNPVWVTNIPREFYDFEDIRTGKWDNYDLMLPGYGEVLSGARREVEYDKIVQKMERNNVQKGNYSLLLELAKEHRLKRVAGAGLGMERTISWLTEAPIGEVQPFPKIPGTVYDL